MIKMGEKRQHCKTSKDGEEKEKEKAKKKEEQNGKPMIVCYFIFFSLLSLFSSLC